MPLPAGTELGTHKILALIGVGGMGEVYKAHDTKLRRDVAIKVLPESFARDADRLARFRREAQLLASLNHPNIATIYNIEDSNRTTFLVMELVPGETLAQRIKRDGAVPVEETLTIAKQIAEALEAAHEKTIIHRDLKPANVKLTPEGKVKVLDFGLAKAFAGDTSTEDMGNSPTLSMAATMQGVILGTAAYMSPEQAKGKAVDKRTDIFAFGAVLYELLTGKPAFHGDDVTDILGAVLRMEPDWSQLPEATPAAIRILLRRCLRKDKRQRLSDATDVRIEIEDAIAAPATAEPTAAAIDTGVLGRRALLLAAGCLLAGALVASLIVWSLRPTRPAQPVSRLVVPLAPNESLTGMSGVTLALSVDGTQLAYVAGASQRIYLRAFDALEAKPLTGTEGAYGPFFSPDGQWIGFTAGGKLKKVAVSGGAVLTLCDVQNSRGAAWGAKDTIVISPSASVGLSQVSAAGGAPQPLTMLKEGETSHRWPQFLPDGKTILYTIGTGGSFDDAQIAAYRLDTGEQKVLIRGGTYARYVPTGHLVYYRAGTIMAARFDTAQLAVLGTPTPAIEGVMSTSGNNGGAQFSFASLGSLVYVPGGPQSDIQTTLVWVDRKRTEQPLPAPPHSYANPRLSPDGRQVAFDIADAGKQDIWIYDLLRDTLTRLTFEGLNSFPVWTPDGKRVAYRSQRPGSYNIFWRPADGSGAYTLRRFRPTAGPLPITCRAKRLATTSGCSPCRGSASLSLSCRLPSTSAVRASLPTATGWPMFPMSRAAMKFTSGLSPVRAANGKFPRREPKKLAGLPRALNSSSAQASSGKR
jgi:Tol biopolymer transport system component